jgi:hypothetical protein
MNWLVERIKDVFNGLMEKHFVVEHNTIHLISVTSENTLF